MPTYEYSCSTCNENFDVVESIKEYCGKGTCPKCGIVSRDRILSANIHFIGAAVQNAEYNPAFGQVVKNKKHRDELAKQKGLIEIGNEKPEKIHKHYDDERATKLKRSWDDV